MVLLQAREEREEGRLDTSNGLEFVRERLALVGKTLFLVSFGFYLFLLTQRTRRCGSRSLDQT